MFNIRAFTGIRDLDAKLLQELEDSDLFDVCTLNKYTLSICNEQFWRNRTLKVFSPVLLVAKPKEMTWKEYYLELSNTDELEGNDKLYYLTLNGKLFFNTVEIKNYDGEVLNDNLIEKAGVSSKKNLLLLLNQYRMTNTGFYGYGDADKIFEDFFDIEFERLGIKENFLTESKIGMLVPLLLASPISTGKVIYSKMYKLYNEEKKFLDKNIEYKIFSLRKITGGF